MIKFFKKYNWTSWSDEIEYYYAYLFKDYVYYPIYRFYKEYCTYRWFVWASQRIFRGFSDRQLWSLDYTFAKYILPRLKYFRNNCLKHSVPSSLCADSDGKEIDFDTAKKEWERIIDTMIYSLEHSVDSEFDPCFYHDKKHGIRVVEEVSGGKQIETFGIHIDENKFKERQLKIQEGLANFGKYFRNLWW